MIIKTNLKNWVMASRPKTLWAAIAPVLIGTALAYADGAAHFLSAIIACIAALVIQIGTNFANDYFDFKHGADGGERLGPVRATQAGLITPHAMKRAFILMYFAALLLGLYLIWRGGWPILIIGVFSIMFGILYTAGPFPLAYYGLGDIFVLIFFGLIAVAGTYYVQALTIKNYVLLAGIAPGLFSTAILTVNNLRDLDNDRRTGKRTLAVRFGKSYARYEYLFCIVTAVVIPFLLIFLNRGHYLSLLSVTVLLLAIKPLKIVFFEKPGKILNNVLADTGKLLFIFSLLFSIGWIIS